MSALISHLDDPAIRRAIETNLTGFFAGVLSKLPDAKSQASDELTSIQTGHASLWLNGIVAHNFTQRDVATTLSEALHPYVDQNQAHFWLVCPSTLPKGLGDRLRDAGLMLLENMPGMVAAIDSLPFDRPLPEGIVTKRVNDDDSLEAWAQAFSIGYQVPIDVTRLFAEASKLSGALNSNSDVSLYVAMAGDQPVGSSAIHYKDGVAGIYCVAADPGLRRRGIGSAITLAALKEARDRGYRVGILHASAAGEPIYLKMGFREIGRFLMYGWFPL